VVQQLIKKLSALLVKQLNMQFLCITGCISTLRRYSSVNLLNAELIILGDLWTGFDQY